MPARKITEFQGEHRFLSNFWPALVRLNGFAFPTVEHAYQAAKVHRPDQHGLFRLIREATTPGRAKRLGASVELGPHWPEAKLRIMADLIAQKFAAHSLLAKMLLETGDATIEEGNAWGDRFWGVDLRTGRGENHLGRLIMARRAALAAEAQQSRDAR